jgi:hypothetical protein
MRIEFQPDFFSNSTPRWILIEKNSDNLLSFVEEFLPEVGRSSKVILECSGTFGINSSNFRVSTTEQTVLIKRWPQSMDREQINPILKLMTWLALEDLPVPIPNSFQDGSKLADFDHYLWSVFPFISGNYFSGQLDEIDTIADMMGRLSQRLSQTPAGLRPAIGPDHLTVRDNEIINTIEKEISKWNVIFGDQNARLLKNRWSYLRSTWQRICESDHNPGEKMATHFDLHPHNILFRDGQVSALLDFESCKIMPLGYSLAFDGLKQCRQAVVANGSIASAGQIGKKYLEILSSSFPIIDPCISNFGDLANAEVMRRLCVIFRGNIEESSSKWNHVLHTQLAHLTESKILFN